MSSDLTRSSKHRDLIYDVGMHKGEDADFYLRKGFRVVGFEADPDLVRACKDRFAGFIATGQLTIVEGAIVDSEGAAAGGRRVRFYKNDRVSVWGTVVGSWAERNARLGNASSGAIEVDAVDFAAVIRRHGMPYYMKVDIEGADMTCVRALRQFAERPDYLSLESSKTSFGRIKGEIDALTDLGYNAFQAIEQSELHATQHPTDPAREGRFIPHRFDEGASGLFGLELGGHWKPRHAILIQYLLISLGYYFLGDDGIAWRWKFRGAGRLRNWIRKALRRLTHAAVPGWYDTHARHASYALRQSVIPAQAGIQANVNL